MKTHKIDPYIVWIILLILTSNAMAQVKEVPITTSSKEALQYFISREGQIRKR